MKWLITGGAGFIGSNAASRLLREGRRVVLLDNFSRPGVRRNLAWLRPQGAFETMECDTRDFAGLESAFRSHLDTDVVLHLAAQVAVTTSVANPREDFEINALGTFNVLEAVRKHVPHAILLNASTNKVYGRLQSIPCTLAGQRYALPDLPRGISEEFPLDFHSPYGCSKGSADQYVRDYARIYSLRTVNFRQSCIYGLRQFGHEDQGWLAWFAICAVLGRPITIYGDGGQVRDVLFVEDLVECYLRAVDRIETVCGQSYNIGGGPQNTLSLLELLAMLDLLLGRRVERRFAGWRPGDQKVFFCDTRKAQREIGWEPRTDVRTGVEKLTGWVKENRELFAASLGATPQTEVALPASAR